ncbi:type I restriction-modification [Synechococcus elongatus PCC 6301]|uniref:Type I restriction-modification n=1 Tax=Synechococcus sp. (strain ATCC 27144 / PCC 6301 / SAUG 1402/1) TaxID=269084 RepID=A0A0H3K0W6_SYNP6|nr:restriction endonuclease subunit S [Synechococcus elongatus]BAD78674.1 type I restriction-modification [Synechococcus elongatus PCC 6301]
MSFPRYPAYKDCGIEWLEKLPSHWNVLQLRRLIPEIESGVSVNALDHAPDEGIPSVLKTSCVYTGSFRPEERKEIIQEDIDRAACPVKSGRLIVSRMNTPDLVGAAGLSLVDYDCVFLPDRLWQVRISNVYPNFAYYWTQTQIYRDQVKMVCSGTSSSMQNLSQDNFLSFILPVPSDEEQIAIASFLDRETAKIDALIAEQQRLIALLQEKRQAVISHAVTKGLNPDAPLKDSGIEWLGQVPAHWKTGKIKHYFKTSSGGTPNTEEQALYYADSDSGIPWVRTTDIENQEVRSAEVSITNQAIQDTACEILPVDTVLVALYGGGGTVGKNGILTFPAAINQALCALLPSYYAVPMFTFRYIQFLRPFWMERAVSARKAGNISQELVRDTVFALPPLDEQILIVKHIHSQLEEITSLENESTKSLSLLQERRSALISAAVTGQIDVRGLAEVAA